MSRIESSKKILIWNEETWPLSNEDTKELIIQSAGDCDAKPDIIEIDSSTSLDGISDGSSLVVAGGPSVERIKYKLDSSRYLPLSLVSKGKFNYLGICAGSMVGLKSNRFFMVKGESRTSLQSFEPPYLIDDWASLAPVFVGDTFDSKKIHPRVVETYLGDDLVRADLVIDGCCFYQLKKGDISRGMKITSCYDEATINFKGSLNYWSDDEEKYLSEFQVNGRGKLDIMTNYNFSYMHETKEEKHTKMSFNYEDVDDPILRLESPVSCLSYKNKSGCKETLFGFHPEATVPESKVWASVQEKGVLSNRLDKQISLDKVGAFESKRESVLKENIKIVAKTLGLDHLD